MNIPQLRRDVAELHAATQGTVSNHMSETLQNCASMIEIFYAQQALINKILWQANITPEIREMCIEALDIRARNVVTVNAC
jgi:hypothetical protein